MVGGQARPFACQTGLNQDLQVQVNPRERSPYDYFM